jgi:hypothetical protein
VPAVTLKICYLRGVSMLSGGPPTQINFMPLHGRAEAEEVHRDHVWWFQTSGKKGSKVQDNSNMLM